MAKETIILWPEVRGQLLDNGKPVAGQRIVQTVYWRFRTEDTPSKVAVTVSDQQGRFVFPSVVENVKFNFIERWFHQPGISTGIETHLNGKKYTIYFGSNLSYFKSSDSPIKIVSDVATAGRFENQNLVDFVEDGR